MFELRALTEFRVRSSQVVVKVLGDIRILWPVLSVRVGGQAVTLEGGFGTVSVPYTV
jgi:hypothetical protein